MARSAAGADARQLVDALRILDSTSMQALTAARSAEDVCRRLKAAADAGLRSARGAMKIFRAGDVVSHVDSIRDQAEGSVDYRVRIHGWALTERLEDLRGQAGESAQQVREVYELVADLERECGDAWSQTQDAYLHLGVVARALNDLCEATIEALELTESWPQADVAEVRAGAMTVKRRLQSGRMQFGFGVAGRIEGHRKDLFDERWDHRVAARDHYTTVVRTCAQIPGLMDQADVRCDALIEALKEIAES